MCEGIQGVQRMIKHYNTVYGDFLRRRQTCLADIDQGQAYYEA